PQSLALSGVTDPYQPIEKRLELTRRCLEVLATFRNPVMIVTKNHLVTRDIDNLAALAEYDAASVALSITTLDPKLSAKLEPRASAPRRRLDAIHKLADAGIPVGVLTAPIIPGLNDPEVPALLQAAAEHGASFAGYTLLRLPGAVLPVFEDWLDQHAPLRKERVLARVRDIRGGKLNEAQFGKRMRGQGTYAKQLSELFHLARRRAGLEKRGSKLSTAAFQRPGEHMGLF
ncbi:MAG: radical SAM protein, partial [Acidobacteriota bacterium]